jgi:hypothetical protein
VVFKRLEQEADFLGLRLTHATAQHQDFHVRFLTSNLGAGFRSAHLGHVVVDEEEVEGIIETFAHGFFAVGGFLDRIPGGSEQRAHQIAHKLVIVGYEDAFGRHRMFKRIECIYVLSGHDGKESLIDKAEVQPGCFFG